MLKYCEICGKPFDAATTAKYCSATCRQIAKHKTRKAWEERTGYKDKRRIEAQEYAKAQLEAAEKQAKEDEKRNERNRKRREAYRRKKEAERLREAVASGDAVARMKAAEPYSYEYWEAYADYEKGCAAANGRDCRRYVNGIAVTDPEFALKVTLSIETLGAIRTETN